MDTALIWVIAGVLLILSELLATSIVAVFFGAAAVLVGLLLWAGVIHSTEMQLILFSFFSLSLLFTSRARLKRYLVGDVVDSDDTHKTFRENLGEEAIAATDFSQGKGRITLNGVAWSAQSLSTDDEISQGDRVWIVANNGIQLTVSKQPPQ